jgi:hypothetical protein
MTPRPTPSHPVPDGVADPVPPVPPLWDGDGGRGHGPADPVPYSDEEWRQRLQGAVAETVRRRAARRRQHQEHTDARAAGLPLRHRRKLDHLATTREDDR